jgi:phage portal protein BeeE
MSFLDTLRAAFKGGGGPRVPLARSFTSPWTWAFEPAGGRPPFDYRTAVARAFLDNPVAQRAVRLVAEGVGSAPLAPTEDDALKLVAATSAGQSLLATLAAPLLLHGNGYAQVVRDGAGQPIELFALRPERVTVIAGADGWPASYQYKVGDRTLTIPVEDEDGWPQLIHLKSFHPADDHYGAGCLAAADQAVAIHNAASGWNRALLENAARPSGALVMEAGDGNTLTANEQAEAYVVGLGDTEQPALRWELGLPVLELSAATLAQLASEHPGQALWVRQVGSFATSPPLLLTIFD